MNISLYVFIKNPAKYFEIAKTTDVIVTKRGGRIGRIISEENTSRIEIQRAIEVLIGSVQLPPEYDDPNYDPNYELLRESAYKDRGLL